ncbi:LysR substrate-binding domain-containing protein [Paraburkholderia antibiotica]|uniref:LysR family transcriptional regulator n=1 Tax=Paraburkholderia antibiotica TaxID=2728839 RepID=A0A7X9ZVF3_9BURK|nr:LysR substrate-binding domain-containing protein [Paraburkholderia antibiotica]NML30069.1 LysR family transcriptional regulator [Paraburkholderia antibiotica]
MNDSADIRFLLTLRASGSLLAAARKLALSPSAVTQRLQQLEKKLGAQLVNRSARRLQFTDEGLLLCERGADLIEQFDALFDDLQTRRRGLVGTLKINAPLGFGRRHLAPAIGEFQQRNPDIDVALTLSDRPLTETLDRFDIVVHIGELPLSNLVGYTIAPNARFVCAAPSLVKRLGMPESPDALSALPCIVLRENSEDVSLWQFSKGRARRNVRVSAHLSCNDGDVIRQWACEGRGVILRSEWDVADDLASGKLVRLLPNWKTPDANVIALTHRRTGLPARTRHFMRYLQSRFKPSPPWRR